MRFPHQLVPGQLDSSMDGVVVLKDGRPWYRCMGGFGTAVFVFQVNSV